MQKPVTVTSQNMEEKIEELNMQWVEEGLKRDWETEDMLRDLIAELRWEKVYGGFHDLVVPESAFNTYIARLVQLYPFTGPEIFEMVAELFSKREALVKEDALRERAERDCTRPEESNKYCIDGKTIDEIKEQAGFKGREWDSYGELFRDIRLALSISRAHAARSIPVSKTSLGRFEAGGAIHHQGDVNDSYQFFLLDTLGEERERTHPTTPAQYLAKLDALLAITNQPWLFMSKSGWDLDKAM